jgi:hypothetical protein
MSYTQAAKQLKKIGVSRAEGPALVAMYAQLVVDAHGGNAERYYDYLITQQGTPLQAAKILLNDRATAWDVLMGAVT